MSTFSRDLKKQYSCFSPRTVHRFNNYPSLEIKFWIDNSNIKKLRVNFSGFSLLLLVMAESSGLNILYMNIFTQFEISL